MTVLLYVACTAPKITRIEPDARVDTGGPPLAPCDEATFTGEPQAWTFPEALSASDFQTPGDVADCDGGPSRSWDLWDVDGDGVDDLVVTRDCEDANVGDDRWRVYLAERNGFGDAEDWDLPGGFSALAFDTPARDEATCTFGSNLPAYFVRDFDGDARPDLVSTRECVDVSTGDAWWRVYPNTGAGFGAAQRWPLPSGFAAYTFETPARALESCSFGTNMPAFGLVDLDGDARPDLVTTDECVDLDVGVDYWHVWTNEGTGFSVTPLAWTVPVGYQPFALTVDVARCANGDFAPAHGLLDLDADGHLDFVSPSDCLDPDVGSTHWNFHRNDGARFAATRTPWPVPGGYAAGTFTRTHRDVPDCSSGSPAFALSELDEDGRADLLVTADCTGSTLGDTHWRVHDNDGAAFVNTPRQVFLPTGYSVYAFELPPRTSPSCAGAANRPAWTLTDLDGDTRRDIVVTGPCEGDVSAWQVHWNACPF